MNRLFAAYSLLTLISIPTLLMGQLAEADNQIKVKTSLPVYPGYFPGEVRTRESSETPFIALRPIENPLEVPPPRSFGSSPELAISLYNVSIKELISLVGNQIEALIVDETANDQKYQFAMRAPDLKAIEKAEALQPWRTRFLEYLEEEQNIIVEKEVREVDVIQMRFHERVQLSNNASSIPINANSRLLFNYTQSHLEKELTSILGLPAFVEGPEGLHYTAIISPDVSNNELPLQDRVHALKFAFPLMRIQIKSRDDVQLGPLQISLEKREMEHWIVQKKPNPEHNK